MTDAAAPSPPQQNAPEPKLSIRNQFIRGLSFDNPGAPTPAVEKPTVNINVRVDANRHGDEDYIATLHIEAAAKDGESTIYDLKLAYAGVFRLENVEERILQPMLLIECPRLLFPFARRIVADVTRDGGYAPLMLDPIDFSRLYRGEMARRAQAQADAGQA